MRKFDGLDYYEFNLKYNLGRDKLFGMSEPFDDYFNDNLDQFYDEDDFYDYTEGLENNFALEDKSFTQSHPTQSRH